MSTIDIFSRIELPKEEVFKHLLNSHTISRCASPFFKLDNFNCKNSKIDQDTYFSQKCVFLELLQLFFTVKEIIPNSKIAFKFDGLIKGTQCINLIEDANSCIIKERLDFSLFNQFNLPLLIFILSIFFYLDTFIRHLRLKNILYKDNGSKTWNLLKEYSTIRSYITINTNITAISSFFEDLNKLDIFLSPFLKIDTTNQSDEFSLSFFLPLFPSFKCKINKKDSNKIIVSFSNPMFTGKNTWSIFTCENELVVENSIEIEHLSSFLKLLWPILGNTLIKTELTNWNQRLKEIAEKTNLSKYFELRVSQA